VKGDKKVEQLQGKKINIPGDFIHIFFKVTAPFHLFPQITTFPYLFILQISCFINLSAPWTTFNSKS
jgi:hypothetical protein